MKYSSCNSYFRLVNESLQMLARYPELNTKILPLMEDYLVALRYSEGPSTVKCQVHSSLVMCQAQSGTVKYHVKSGTVKPGIYKKTITEAEKPTLETYS